MKVKNNTDEKLIEPYYGVVLEPGEVKDLEEPYLSRVLSVFVGKVSLVLEEEDEKGEGEEKERSKRGRKPKKETEEEEVGGNVENE